MTRIGIESHRTIMRWTAALVVSIGAACGGARTSVTEMWHAPAPDAMPMKSVIVFGARMDEASRRSLEDAFVSELAEHGVRGTPSYAAFQGPAPDPEWARAKVSQLGLEGILVLTLKNVSERTTYVPSYSGSFWSAYYGPGWWGGPGYVVEDEIVTFESTLWDARAGDRLVWAALTKTNNPSSGKSYVESLVKAIMPKLEDARLVPPERR